MSFKPMLSPIEDPLKTPNFFERIRYPLLGSPKLDGIRGITLNGQVFSRSGKLIPSYQVQEEFGELPYLDGELIVGNATDFGVYNRTQSHVMAFDKPAEIFYHVFDYVHPDWLHKPFHERLDKAMAVVQAFGHKDNIRFVAHSPIDTHAELVGYEEICLREGYEGIMMRDPVGRYKNGRGTFNEGLIYKLKRFTDAEGEIVGFVEEMKNTNEQFKDELGKSKRSTSQEGLIPTGTLGKFLVLFGNDTLQVGCGSFSHPERQSIWNNQSLHRGQLLKFRYFGHGVKDQPRMARAIGFRDPMDL
jgi:DNA ligase-1